MALSSAFVRWLSRDGRLADRGSWRLRCCRFTLVRPSIGGRCEVVCRIKIVCLHMLKKVGASICWPRNLEAGAESPAGRALIVGAVRRFRSLTKPRMGAWLTEDYEGLQTETTTTVCWQVLEISAVVCCPRILKGGAEDRLPKVGLSLTCRI